MRSTVEQARGDSREDPHIRILRQQFLGAAASQPKASIDFPGSTTIETRKDLVRGYLTSEVDYPAAKAPIAPVEDR
jgi:hypothetical protein